MSHPWAHTQAEVLGEELESREFDVLMRAEMQVPDQKRLHAFPPLPRDNVAGSMEGKVHVEKRR